MPYLAHSANRLGRTEQLADHLTKVARRAAEFASAFGAEKEAYMAGLFHDLGKYGNLFQERLSGHEKAVDHWSHGALLAALDDNRPNRPNEPGLASAFAILGHHTGLEQAYPSVLSRLNRTVKNGGTPELRISKESTDELVQRATNDGLDLSAAREIKQSIYSGFSGKAAAMLDIRMIYSTLVDADFLETESHFEANDSGLYQRPEPPPLEPDRALKALMDHVRVVAAESDASTQIKSLRQDLLEACLKAADSPQGTFTLTAPTGSGKTLAMLAFALKHAAKHRLRRVIVVIPYLSIIEQTVSAYRKALSGTVSEHLLDEYILEHHSLAGIGTDSSHGLYIDYEKQSNRRREQLTENWTSPIIVTTSVQFLESLFSNRPSACRKLHNIAGSVVLFDEVQTLPTSLVVPTLATLSRLAERYRASVVFSTATQPAFETLDTAVKKLCAPGWKPVEIVPESLSLFNRARRASIYWPVREAIPWHELIKELAAFKQVLCIVNLKRHAADVYKRLKELCGDGVYHLSTNMCPLHRQVVLDDVRRRLKNGEPCRLVATQCVEAGVDLDFPSVYRAMGPLDAIAQAAGRCNRGGKQAEGTVKVFIPEEEAYPDGNYRQAAACTSSLLERYRLKAQEPDINQPGLFLDYYQDLYSIRNLGNDKSPIIEQVRIQHFAEVARLYRIIDSGAVDVLVPYDPVQYRKLKDEVYRTGVTREWTIRARPHAIGLYCPGEGDPARDFLSQLNVRNKNGWEPCDGWYIYTGEADYHPALGLVLPRESRCLIA